MKWPARRWRHKHSHLKYDCVEIAGERSAKGPPGEGQQKVARASHQDIVGIGLTLAEHDIQPNGKADTHHRGGVSGSCDVERPLDEATWRQDTGEEVDIGKTLRMGPTTTSMRESGREAAQTTRGSFKTARPSPNTSPSATLPLLHTRVAKAGKHQASHDARQPRPRPRHIHATSTPLPRHIPATSTPHPRHIHATFTPHPPTPDPRPPSETPELPPEWMSK